MSYNMIAFGLADTPELCQPKHARERAQELLMLLAANPGARVHLWMAAWDSDPRELWEIPEVHAFLLAWWKALLQHGWHWESVKRFDPDGRLLLAVALGFVDPDRMRAK